MTNFDKLSEHDKELISRIRKLDDYGYIKWPEISHLADQLEDSSWREYWNDVCKHYNHMEEASIRAL